MNVSYVSRKLRAGLAIGFTLVMAACAVIVDVGGEGPVKFHFEGYVGQLPAGAKPMDVKAKVAVPGVGTFEVNVYDTDGDGVGDTGGPIPPDGRYVKGHVVSDPQKDHPGFVSVTSRSVTAEQPEPRSEEFIIYEKPPAHLMPVSFDKSVAAYLVQYGLTGVREGDNGATNLVEVLGANSDASVPSGVSLDVRLHWNTEAGWVDIKQFPSLQYEFYGLSDPPNTWPHYMELRVVGDSGSVLNWLGHFGITELHFQSVEISGPAGGHQTIADLAIEIHEAAGFAQISIDGSIHFVPLNW